MLETEERKKEGDRGEGRERKWERFGSENNNRTLDLEKTKLWPDVQHWDVEDVMKNILRQIQGLWKMYTHF